VVKYDATKIQVLKDIEAVRHRPAMYIGDIGRRGLHHLAFEVVDNSIDEAAVGYCNKINVIVHKDNSVTVTDNGRGIPVDIHPVRKKPGVEVVMTTLHSGSKFDDKIYRVSGGLHGVGVSVVNALSDWLEVEVRRNGKVYHQRYERGVVKTELEIKGEVQKREKGTKVTFHPDPEIFEVIHYDFETIAERLRELAFLNKGIALEIFDERDERSQKFKHAGGLVEFVEFIDKGKDPLHPPIYFHEEKDDVDVEVALQYTSTYAENIFTYANNVNTREGGTHLVGFKTALTRVINDYGRKEDFLKKVVLSGDDAREGLTAVLSVKVRDPQFEGQTKTKLGNSEVKGIVTSIINEYLSLYLEEHPDIAIAVMNKVLVAAKSRIAAQEARRITRKRDAIESHMLPGKLADCSSKEPSERELFMVEGDSAGGSAKQGRDKAFQAILPLKGKIINVEKARIDKVLSNTEIKSIISALGTGMGDNGFDAEKLRYHKVIIMTDADVDGAHIRTLLLTFFYRHGRELIENGHIYIAQPPLYKIKRKKKVAYAYTESELEEVLKEGDAEIQRFKGLGEMNADELFDTTMNPQTRRLKRVELDDAIEAERIFTILMGEEVEPRRDFIETNAKFVKNLDV
jgi:DNA gyrase subunit B